MKTVGIIGFGRVGSTMAFLLAERGYQVKVVLHRSKLSRVVLRSRELEVKSLEQVAEEADLLFITTPDRAIGEVVQELINFNFLHPKAVLHMSGKSSAHILWPLKDRGIAVGSLHPMQSLAGLDQALTNLAGSSFTFEGDSSLLPWISSLVTSLNCKLIVAPFSFNKALYHAGASIASNFLVVLAKMGLDCLKLSGLSESESQEALTVLMRGTLNNLAGLPPGQALTGPIARGDWETVSGHVEILKKHLSHLLPAYQALGNLTADLAFQSGSLDPVQHRKIKKVIYWR